MSDSVVEILAREDGEAIAYCRRAGQSPRHSTGQGTGHSTGVMFLGGFASDMTGSKALFLEDHTKARGLAFLRFDYSGHGASGGDFKDGTIGAWTKDALHVFDHLTQGPQILIGSSMGGWIMLLLALARPQRVAGLIGIAAAPDFTEDLIWELIGPEEKLALKQDGFFRERSDYDQEGLIITKKLIDEGRNHLLLRGGPLAIAAPVRLLHGMQDSSVPWVTAPRLAEKLAGHDVEVHLIKDGDHRLSRDQDLARLGVVLDRLVSELGTDRL